MWAYKTRVGQGVSIVLHLCVAFMEQLDQPEQPGLARMSSLWVKEEQWEALSKKCSMESLEEAPPSGPSSLNEIMSWATDEIAEIVSNTEWQCERLFNNLKRGLLVGSNYSGIKAPEFALTQIMAAARAAAPAAEYGPLPQPMASMAWSCDIAQECREVALAWASEEWHMEEHHVFTNLYDYLAEDAVTAFWKMQPLKGEAPDISKQKVANLTHWFMNRTYDVLRDAHCSKHGCRCRPLLNQRLRLCLQAKPQKQMQQQLAATPQEQQQWQ